MLCLLPKKRAQKRCSCGRQDVFLTRFGGFMKFCQVALILTLGVTAETALNAQALLAGNSLAGTVMVANDVMPEGVLFPDVLAGASHDSLVEGLGIIPEISQSMPQPAAPAEPTRRLTRTDRWNLFLNDTYASPGAYAGLFAGAAVDQILHSPAKWDQDGNGYTRRFSSEYGQLAARNVIHDGLAGVTGLDPRYAPCHCGGLMHRSAHALEMTFTTYRQDGRVVLNMPQIAGAYGSGMISTYWYPHRQFSPLVQGVQFGHEQMGEVFVGNLVQEFGPGLKRSLHVHALASLSRPRPSDD